MDYTAPPQTSREHSFLLLVGILALSTSPSDTYLPLFRIRFNGPSDCEITMKFALGLARGEFRIFLLKWRIQKIFRFSVYTWYIDSCMVVLTCRANVLKERVDV